MQETMQMATVRFTAPRRNEELQNWRSGEI